MTSLHGQLAATFGRASLMTTHGRSVTIWPNGVEASQATVTAIVVEDDGDFEEAERGGKQIRELLVGLNADDVAEPNERMKIIIGGATYQVIQINAGNVAGADDAADPSGTGDGASSGGIHWVRVRRTRLMERTTPGYRRRAN